MTTLYLDLETRNDVDLPKRGSFRYAEGVEILLFAFAIDDEPVYVWDVASGKPMPERLKTLLHWAERPGEVEVVIHNSVFDREMIRSALGISIAFENIWDTAVQAVAHSLPASLAALSEIYKLGDQGKDSKGKDLIKLFCLPQSVKLQQATGRKYNDRRTHPLQWLEFIHYAGNDIIAMRELKRLMPRWNMNVFERAMRVIDHRINNRGIGIDRNLATGAVKAVDKAKADLAAECFRLTDGELESTTRAAALKAFLKEHYHIDLPDLKASTVDNLIETLAPGIPRDLLSNRRYAASTAATKYEVCLGAVNSDGRLRGVIVYCGAGRTGRFASRLFNVQNLPRGTLHEQELEDAIYRLGLNAEFERPADAIEAATSSLRGLIVPAAGNKFVIADLSNIEGRVLSWLACETWKLHAFEDFDTGLGDDLYVLAYSRSFGCWPSQVGKPQRQVGKCLELSMGFAAGVSGLKTFLDAYRVDINTLDLSDVPEWAWEKSASVLAFVLQKKMPFPAGITHQQFMELDTLKQLWREAHPATVAFWKQVESAFLACIQNEGLTVTVGRLQFRRKGAWLCVQLPSGRCLQYASPRARYVENEDGEKELELSFMGMNPETYKWGRIRTHRGKLVENIVQAVARDVLCCGIMNAEAAGYEVVMHVHDEIICEVPNSPRYNVTELCKLMTTNIPWADGLPLAAAGFETDRYKKD